MPSRLPILITGARAVHIDPSVLDDDLRAVAIMGHCHSFAAALADKTGWRLAAVFGDDGAPHHVGCLTEHGDIVDVTGQWDAEVWADMWGGEWELLEEPVEQLYAYDFPRAQPDLFTPTADAVATWLEAAKAAGDEPNVGIDEVERLQGISVGEDAPELELFAGLDDEHQPLWLRVPANEWSDEAQAVYAGAQRRAWAFAFAMRRPTLPTALAINEVGELADATPLNEAQTQALLASGPIPVGEFIRGCEEMGWDVRLATMSVFRRLDVADELMRLGRGPTDEQISAYLRAHELDRPKLDAVDEPRKAPASAADSLQTPKLP